MDHPSTPYERLHPDRSTSKAHVASISSVPGHLDRSDFTFVVTCSQLGDVSYFRRVGETRCEKVEAKEFQTRRYIRTIGFGSRTRD